MRADVHTRPLPTLCRWPELESQLVGIARVGDTYQELVAMLLACVAEEASSTELAASMPIQRQQEIMQVRATHTHTHTERPSRDSGAAPRHTQ